MKDFLIHYLKQENNHYLHSIIQGSVFVVLTDTIYGLSCVYDNKKAINKIDKIKQIATHRPFIVLVSDMSMLSKFFYLSNDQKKIIEIMNDRPTSFILQAKKQLYTKLGLSKEVGVAVRLPKSKNLVKIIKSVNKPLVSTSCNITGQKALNKLSDIKIFSQKAKDIDFIISFPSLRPKKKASRLLDIRDLNNIKVIRK